MPKKSAKSLALAVIFGLTKGEGEWPSPSDLTQAEKKDPRKFSTFQLSLDEGIEGAPDRKIIKKCTIIYNGISPVPSPHPDSEKDYFYGLKVIGDSLVGNIRPIVLFELAGPVDHEVFQPFVWGSSYELLPEAQEEPFYAEDWNGYTSVMGAEDLHAWIAHLKEHNVYSGKSFTVKKLEDGALATSM